MNLRQIQARIERVGYLLERQKGLRDDIIDPILEAYGRTPCWTHSIEFHPDGVKVIYCWEDGWHEEQRDSILVPYSVIDADDPARAAREAVAAARDAKAKTEADARTARELQELGRLQAKYAR